MEGLTISPTLILVVVIAFYLISSIQILAEYERGVIFRLGKLLPQPKGPGVIFVFRPIDRIVRISLRTVVLDVPPQDIITRDNVSVKVNAVVYFRVVDPRRAVVEVENYMFATSQLAQTTLRSVLGQAELDDLLAERDRLNQQLQTILDHRTDPWGIKVSAVEVKHVDLPQDMQRAMARQAEAEREKRAKIIHAEGELIASEKLAQAAGVIDREPAAMTLRYLQTLTEIAAEQNSTIIFPLPIELMRMLRGRTPHSRPRPMVGYSWTDPAVLTFIAIPLGLVAALLWLVDLASRRLDEPAENRRGALVGTAAIAVAWMTATWIAASSGVLRQWDATPPPFAFLVAGIVALSAAIAFSPLRRRGSRQAYRLRYSSRSRDFDCLWNWRCTRCTSAE